MKKILIVEDEQTLVKALTSKLENEGFEAEGAINGEEGMKLAKSKKPDLILLDVIMPRMDGMTMLKKLKEDEETKNIPVIMLTNLSDDKRVAESIESGAHDYLIKADWKIEDVVVKVKKKLAE